MMYIRQRKEIKTIEVSEDLPAQKENVKLENKLPPSGCAYGRFWKVLSLAVGGTVALCIGLLTSVYLATLHENDLWFSNIKILSLNEVSSLLSKCQANPVTLRSERRQDRLSALRLQMELQSAVLRRWQDLRDEASSSVMRTVRRGTRSHTQLS